MTEVYKNERGYLLVVWCKFRNYVFVFIVEPLVLVIIIGVGQFILQFILIDIKNK